MTTQQKTTTRTASKSTASGRLFRRRAGSDERARPGTEDSRAPAAKADGANDVLAKIAEMSDTDRAMAEWIHALVAANAPELTPKLWYGMPAYAKDGKVVCFFQSAAKFKARYATLGFNDSATLDDGDLWPTAFALNGTTPATPARIGDILRKSVS